MIAVAALNSAPAAERESVSPRAGMALVVPYEQEPTSPREQVATAAVLLDATVQDGSPESVSAQARGLAARPADAKAEQEHCWDAKVSASLVVLVQDSARILVVRKAACLNEMAATVPALAQGALALVAHLDLQTDYADWQSCSPALRLDCYWQGRGRLSLRVLRRGRAMHPLVESPPRRVARDSLKPSSSYHLWPLECVVSAAESVKRDARLPRLAPVLLAAR